MISSAFSVLKKFLEY